MGIGPAGAARATGTVDADFVVSKTGHSVRAVIDYAAPNPLFKGSPDIDATGEFTLTSGRGNLTIDAKITGDQFPACESFIQDPKGNKIFLGGFAPQSKEQIKRLILYEYVAWFKEIWFESHVVVQVDSSGAFHELQGGGSGSNAAGTACENLMMSLTSWNARIMSSIPMPLDAH